MILVDDLVNVSHALPKHMQKDKEQEVPGYHKSGQADEHRKRKQHGELARHSFCGLTDVTRAVLKMLRQAASRTAFAARAEWRSGFLALSHTRLAEVRSFGTSAQQTDKKEKLKQELLKEATGKAGNLHHSNAEQLINEVPPIKVKGNVAVCDGGGGALGHPVEYIQLNLTKDKPSVCKYCGLRYEMDHHHH